MSIDHVDIVDAALLLDGLADVLDLLPPLEEEWESDERAAVARACRVAAQLAAGHSNTGQSYDAAKGYVGSEWRNALLRSLVGATNARGVLNDAYKRRGSS